MKYSRGEFRRLLSQWSSRDDVGSLELNSAAELHQSSRVMLLVNADLYTAWNIRRCLMSGGFLDSASELRLLNLIFSKHPKSGEAWAHRRWVLKQLPTFLQRDGAADTSVVRRNAMFEGELQSCAKSAELHSRNYYAWSHRQWLTDQLDSSELVLEITRSRLWSDVHVSDHSALSHRQSMLRRLQELNEDDVEDELQREQQHIEQLIDRYPGHESLWSHARFVWLCSTRCQRSHAEVSLQTLAQRAIDAAQASVEDDGVSLFERQRRFAASYQFWVLLHAEADADTDRAWTRSSGARICTQMLRFAPQHTSFWRAQLHRLTAPL